MAIGDFLPSFRAKTTETVPMIEPFEEKSAKIIDQEDQKALARGFRVKALALGYDGIPDFMSKRANFEDSPYDFEQITRAIDTDSYAKSSFAKFRELFWKEGWSIVGENQDAVDYLYQRLDYMELAMGRPFQDFMLDVMDQLVRYHNVFIVKARSDEIEEQFPDSLDTEAKKGPIIGYYLIPTEQVQILRDKHNRPKYYRQRVNSNLGLLSSTGNTTPRTQSPTWAAREVIHMYRDRKIGRAFGTPFLTSALDDLLALRQVEEDYLNLIHRELFPLYKYTVGTEDVPAEDDEIIKAVQSLESLRSEGGLVIPFRHDVEIIGSEGKTLEIGGFLDHMKERVANGLGVFPHHLGMVSFSGANRDMTDRLDAALYDRVKEYQRAFADYMRMYIFDELLREGGFEPMMNPKLQGDQDRCVMVFDEIDADGQIKRESHVVQKVTAGLETVPEGRRQLRLPPEMNEKETLLAMQVRLQPTTQVLPGEKMASGGTKAPKIVDTTPPAAQKPGAQKPSTGGKPNLKNVNKGATNLVRPANQHGSRTSPNIRRSDDDWYTEVVELVGEDYQIIEEES